jgi:hypothetical protein
MFKISWRLRSVEDSFDGDYSDGSAGITRRYELVSSCSVVYEVIDAKNLFI